MTFSYAARLAYIPTASLLCLCGTLELVPIKTLAAGSDANEPLQWRASQSKPIYTMTSDQSRLPAEFKHINKRRKRKQQ